MIQTIAETVCLAIRDVLSVAIDKAKSKAHNAYIASGTDGDTTRTSVVDEIAKLLFGTEQNIVNAGGKQFRPYYKIMIFYIDTRVQSA